ncbi:hypothetical protein ZIOFF_047936 [Zingiber officinale]|uniref:Uncharacterized protein n=1 Tax=Zingiber officinale TaxID=94328 RepID=A0A8J5KU17_ZINOF|nr:hypothetical protein ZIOFF_047936 [Zingiber officinale]
MCQWLASNPNELHLVNRMDEVGSSKSVNFDGARKMALKQIEEFLLSFSDPHIFSEAATSSAPATLAQVVEAVRIPEAGNLICSAAAIGKYVSMLQNPSSLLRACAAFAFVQFTLPGGQHAMHHAGLLQNAGASPVLRASAEAATARIESKMYARIVLRNLEHLQSSPSTQF